MKNISINLIIIVIYYHKKHELIEKVVDLVFIEDFTNSQSLRRIISSGYEVLKLCLDEARKLNT